ncbi:MAG: PEP-CTERM sorting domain-containing protein [Candidatus Acidiferrales bacterium]
MRHLFSIAASLALFLIFSGGTARADSTPVTYSLTGPVDATFEIPLNPTITTFVLGEGFYVTPIDFMINGAPAPSGDFLIFYNTAVDGGFADWDQFFSLTGPQLYAGPENAPTMLSNIPGSIPLTDFFTGASYTATVSAPEPTTLLLLSSGLIVLAWKQRRRAARPSREV